MSSIEASIEKALLKAFLQLKNKCRQMQPLLSIFHRIKLEGKFLLRILGKFSFCKYIWTVMEVPRVSGTYAGKTVSGTTWGACTDTLLRFY